MTNIRIIPSLLISKSRAVKGKMFTNHKDCGDIVRLCNAHEAQLADEIILIDLDAFLKKIPPKGDIVKEVNQECSTPLIFGGNISSLMDALVIINNGADKILINTNLKKKLAKELSNYFGKQAVVAGIDLIKKNDKYVVFNKKKYVDPLKWIKKILKMDVGELKVTFVDYEGSGKNFDYRYAKKILEYSDRPVIFEGGFGNVEHINKAVKLGIESIALGSMLIYRDNNIFKIKQYLENNGHTVRLRN